MKRWLALLLGLVGVVGSWAVASAAQRSDFALLNMPGGDTSVQCGARRGNGPGSFTYHVTMTNVGAAGFVRVDYADGDFVGYQIPAGGSFSFSQAAGGTKSVDDLIRVRGTGGAVLVGSMSALFDTGAHPHPALAPHFCTTSP
jgi:hypothetical protein